MPRRTAFLRLLLATTPLALAACDDSTAPGDATHVALSFSSGTNATPAGAVASSVRANVLVSGADTLRLTRVRVVLDEIELYRAGAPTCGDSYGHTSGDDDSGHHSSSSSSSSSDCGEVETGPHLVELAANGSLTAPIDVRIPSGSYTKLELKLRPVNPNSGSDAPFRAAHPDVAGASVIVEGTFRGQPFTWRSSLEADHELYFNPALVVDGGTRVTVNIDVGRWFRTSGGAIIDPASAQPGGPFSGIVAANIAASFEAFEDHDRNGRRDGNPDVPNHT